MRRTVLCIGIDAATCVSLVKVCRPRLLDLVQLPWGPRAVELIEKVRLAAVIAAYPVPTGDFGTFLSKLRAATSPSPRSALVLVASAAAREAARLFIGRGVNRVHPLNDPVEKLSETLLELCDVAPRVHVRGTVRVRAQVDNLPRETLCDMENLSTSGMLLRGWITYPVGQTFDFDLKIPELHSSIRGQAVVTRLTDVTREKFNGLGARFTSIRQADHARLDALITRHMQ